MLPSSPGLTKISTGSPHIPSCSSSQRLLSKPTGRNQLSLPQRHPPLTVHKLETRLEMRPSPHQTTELCEMTGVEEKVSFEVCRAL